MSSICPEPVAKTNRLRAEHNPEQGSRAGTPPAEASHVHILCRAKSAAWTCALYACLEENCTLAVVRRLQPRSTNRCFAS